MNDMANFYPMIADCIVAVVRCVIAVAFGVLIIPWLKNCAIPWLKEKRLYGMISRFVRAAEQMADAGIIPKDQKLSHVAELLIDKGIDMTPEVRALIESAVGDLNAEFMYNLGNVAGLFIEDDYDEAGDEEEADEAEAEAEPDADEDEGRDVEPLDEPEEAAAE